MAADTPLDPTHWTLDTVRDLLRHSSYEPDRYDFKGALYESGEEKAKPRKGDAEGGLVPSICKTTCSMANGYGGFLVFGVREPREGDASFEDRIVGIPVRGEPQKEFGDKIQGIRPSVHYEPAPKLLEVTGRAGQGIFVVYIPRSSMRPHMYDGRFWKRGHGRSEFMDVGEIREQMLNTEERLRKLELLRTRIAFLNQTVGEIKDEGDENLRVVRFDTSGLSSLISETCALFPFDKRLEEELTSLILAANHANGLMDRLNQWAVAGGYGPHVVSQWRTKANLRLETILQKTKTSGAMVKEILDGARKRV